MRESLHREHAALAQLARRRWRRPVLWSGIACAILIAGAAIWWRGAQRTVDCATAVRSLASGVATVVCQREYERSRLPTTGTDLANALFRSGEFTAASALAKELLITEVRGDALQLLARIALEQNRGDDALGLLGDARAWHRERGRRSDLAVDLRIMADIYATREQYAEALRLLGDCVEEAKGGGDTRIEGFCHLSAASALIRVGHFDVARQQLDHARAQLTEDRDLAQVWYWSGNLEQETVRGSLRQSHDEQAVVMLRRSLDLMIRSQFTSRLVNTHLSLVYSLAELGRVDEATRHLEEAGVLDRDGMYTSQRTQLAARIAYHRGNHTLAFTLNERALRDSDDLDEQIEICVMQARIELARNDFTSAARWARRGVEFAERIRVMQTVSELRPWVLATRREPYELLFTALARANQVNDAIAVFDRWQGRTLLDKIARLGIGDSPGLAETAAKIQNLGRWLEIASHAPLLASDGGAVVQIPANIDLIALVFADGTLWRITASLGQVRLDALGTQAEFQDLLDSFRSDPTKPAVASAAGARIIPADLARTTREPLYVVLDAPVDGLSFAALRQHGRPMIAWRPVQRMLRLPTPSACNPAPRSGSAFVIADVTGNLPAARLEASHVASLFGTTPRVGPQATSEALFAASNGFLLHVAVHADVDAGGGFLALRDRAVSASEISASKLAVPLVVLSACNTARASDPESAGSLSAAFLAAGSRRVLATLRPIRDDRARDVTSRFYDAGGASDPVHVLASVQAELAKTSNKEWPNFAVFGADTCPQF